MRTKRKRTERRKFRQVKRERKLTLVTNFTLDDVRAEVQGRAIVKHNNLAIHAPRLNFTYMLDGFAVPSGKRHRKIG